MYLLLNHFYINPPQGSSPNVLGTWFKNSKAHISPLSSTPISASLKEAAFGPLKDSQGTYAMVIKNLKTGEVFYQDEHREFDSGSLYKLWTMATVYEQIEKGSLKEDQELSDDIETLNQKFNIDPEYAEQTDGTISLTTNSALKQMITISHNYAALLLTETVKLSSMAQFLKDHEYDESSVGISGEAPVTTAADMAKFMEDLYQGKLGNKASTQKMLDLLKAQQLNDKLPKYLPKDVVIAHKTGEIDSFSHDAGIVYTPEGDYIIVILSDSTIPAAAEDRMALVSQSVYEYFMKGGENK